MKVSLADKKAEAVKRMQMLGVYPETIRQFDKENFVSISEPPFGAFYWVDDETEKIIKDFERKYNSLVYMVVRSYFKELGKMDSLLFVSDYKDEEWEMDRNDIRHGQALAYVYSYDEPIFSEIGPVGLKPTIAAGLKRVW